MSTTLNQFARTTEPDADDSAELSVNSARSAGPVPASEHTVREIAASNPSAARILGALGIDYCCGGTRSLKQACATANVPVETVVALLETCETPLAQPEPLDATLGDLTQHIVNKHHGYVRRESPRIQAMLAKVCEKHGRAHRELYQVSDLFAALAEELSVHMMKEERILFPYIESLEAPDACCGACAASVETPIAAMMADHESAGAILRKLRELMHDYKAPQGACPTFQGMYRAMEEFERDLHWHVHLENNILFPRAVAMEREKRAAAPSR